MKNFKFMMVLFVMIAALCITACESDKDDESVTVVPTCDPACVGDTECKCEGDKCECVNSVKPEECKCEPELDHICILLVLLSQCIHIYHLHTCILYLQHMQART